MVDFQVNGETKLYDVTKNKIQNFPVFFHKLTKNDNSLKSRTFLSDQCVFTLSQTEQKLVFHYDKCKAQLEIINHDCMDFVTYQNKSTNQITVLSFIEQNDELCLRLDELVLNQAEAESEAAVSLAPAAQTPGQQDTVPTPIKSQ